MMMHCKTGCRATRRARDGARVEGRSSHAARHISNRNIRFTGFLLTTPESVLTYFLTTTKSAISEFRGLGFRAPCCLRCNALESWNECIGRFAGGAGRVAWEARQ